MSDNQAKLRDRIRALNCGDPIYTTRPVRGGYIGEVKFMGLTVKAAEAEVLPTIKKAKQFVAGLDWERLGNLDKLEDLLAKEEEAVEAAANLAIAAPAQAQAIASLALALPFQTNPFPLPFHQQVPTATITQQQNVHQSTNSSDPAQARRISTAAEAASALRLLLEFYASSGDRQRAREAYERGDQFLRQGLDAKFRDNDEETKE